MRSELMPCFVGKKSYTMVVGKINPAKLANFPEIELWTVIACTENTLMDSKEYYRPFITPFELAQALSAYVCSFPYCNVTIPVFYELFFVAIYLATVAEVCVCGSHLALMQRGDAG